MRSKKIITKPGASRTDAGRASRFLRYFERLQRIHPVMVPILTFCAMLVLSLAGYAYFTRDRAHAAGALIVIINHDKMERTVPTRPTTVGRLLQKLDIQVGPGDVVEPAADTPIRQDDFRINVYRAKPVQIDDGSRKTTAFSAATTPRSIAMQAGAALNPEDTVVTEPVTNFLQDGTIGQKVIIDRAKPVMVNLYGNPVNLRTHAHTVAELLKEKNIILGPTDQVQPSLDTPLQADSQIFLLRKGVQIATVTEDIPMDVQTIQDASLAFGTSAVRQQGSPGKRIVTYQIDTENGREVGRTVIQTVISQQPVAQIVVQGTSLSGIKGNMALAGISPGDYNYVDYIISHESGWCPTKAQGQVGGCPAFSGNVPSYGGYGLCQSTPPQKMASAGADWETNPVTQLRWCNGYALGRYGSWGTAYNHWVSNHNW